MTADTGSPSGEALARRLERAYEQMSAVLQRPDVAERMRAAPGEREWSALQVVGHVIEMIPYWLDKCHLIIAAQEPPQFGRTHDAPERLAGVALGTSRDAGELLSQLKQVVEAAAKDIRGMTEADRSKSGVHSSQGSMTVAGVVERLIVEHAEAHVGQVQEALKLPGGGAA